MALRKVSTTMMEKRSSTEEEWLGWIEVLKTVNQTWMAGDPEKAVSSLNHYLASDPPTDLYREALSFRAWIHRDLDDLSAAKADSLAALKLAKDEPRYIRHTLEDSIAFLCLEIGEPVEAESWLLRALRTASRDPRAAGGGTLLRLLRLRGERGLNETERQIARRMVQQSWNLLRINGEPDLKNLEQCARKLVEAQGKPFSAD